MKLLHILCFRELQRNSLVFFLKKRLYFRCIFVSISLFKIPMKILFIVNVTCKCDMFSPKAKHNQQRSIHCFVLLFVPRRRQYNGNHWFWSLINVRLKNAMIPCQSLHMLCCFYYYNEYKYHKNKRQARCPNIKVCTCNNF